MQRGSGESFKQIKKVFLRKLRAKLISLRNEQKSIKKHYNQMVS